MIGITMAMITLPTPVPGMATTHSARMISGNDRNTSISRCTVMSMRPPTLPRAAPITRPAEAPTMAAETPTSSAVREPKMRRDRTARPKASVPSQCAALGGANIAP
jgi:hypothetical protein